MRHGCGGVADLQREQRPDSWLRGVAGLLLHQMSAAHAALRKKIRRDLRVVAGLVFHALWRRPIAEIVHEIDLRDGRYARPETAGIDAILKGWLLAGLSDVELESRGTALFEGLFVAQASPSKKSADRLLYGGSR